MNTFFQEYFSRHPDFENLNNIYYQKDFPRASAFEKDYLELRRKEGRLFTNEEILALPDAPISSNSSGEWRIRKRSADKLIGYLERKNFKTVSEVGCGNGWLIRYLNRHLRGEFCGIDVNEWELCQAAHVNSDQQCFVYGDIFSSHLNDFRTDVFILASCIQYFPDPGDLINRLRSLLNDGGEIHILDSPFYTEDSSRQADLRSASYFKSLDAEGMNTFYHHHTWKDLEAFSYKVLYDPRAFVNFFGKKFASHSPFPWICITKNQVISS